MNPSGSLVQRRGWLESEQAVPVPIKGNSLAKHSMTAESVHGAKVQLMELEKWSLAGRELMLLGLNT